MAAWNIGIDHTPPTTAILSLPPAEPSNAFLIEWNASDNLSGLNYFNVQESVNGADWTNLPQIDGGVFDYWVIGSPGNSYSFRMRGVDKSGNTEFYPANAEASTTIPGANVLCYAPDNFDTSGNDNSPGNASLIYLDGLGQSHNFCNPLIPGYQNDEDWIRLTPIPGHRYLFSMIADSAPSAAQISLFAQDGTTLLGQAAAQAFGGDTTLAWLADRSEPVYIRLRDVDGRIIGSDIGGTFYVKTGLVTYLPLMNH